MIFLKRPGGYKIFSDPLYGFIKIPEGLLLRIIDHAWFQRLRHIKQTGLTYLVYPGAVHTRFHHLLGALHLTMQAIKELRDKGADITEDEEMGTYAAILLHDIGHGPFSHALEGRWIRGVSHEQLSLWYMEALNALWDGELEMAIALYKGRYPKQYLSQLISSQLDMDRLDYLRRDSFYTGVAEGVIGQDRIIKTLAVADGRLVVEEKGKFSVEKFLIARYFMYWQVYLHKTVLAAEVMLQKFWDRLEELALEGAYTPISPEMHYFIHLKNAQEAGKEEIIRRHAGLTDVDLEFELKRALSAEDPLLRYLAEGLVRRRIFRLVFDKSGLSAEEKSALTKAMRAVGITDLEAVVWHGEEKTRVYESKPVQEIYLRLKDGSVQPLSQMSTFHYEARPGSRWYLCYPRLD